MNLLRPRTIGYLIGLLLVLCVERVIGLPVFFIAASLLVLATLHTFGERVAATIFLSWALAIVFQLLFTLAVGLLIATQIWLDHGSGILKNSRLRLFLSVLLSVILIATVNRSHIGWLQVVIGTVSVSGLLFMSKALLIWEQRSPGSLQWSKNMWRPPQLKTKL